ncbi:MAG: tRNA glutamyl-Q(34) synthetase GluQRS [Methylococcales bacterium]|nr:tRNA glutamyl-Q(34) synthetase GluQRS [Methylococcales bacterium]
MTDKQPYIGRFAPSPTGPLHLGSLYTALASYLDAKSHQGQWSLRIDDLDTPRNLSGAADYILSTLDAFGLHWDGGVTYQSDCIAFYEAELARLINTQIIYPCACSRKTLATDGECYCINKQIDLTVPHAYRVKTDQSLIQFVDQIQGLVSISMAEQADFILKRKDQILAYQFAVVVDDHIKGVNHVVRGCDLLDSTPKQIYLQKLLGFALPVYMHVPVIKDAHGFKLSKQTLAEGVNLKDSQKIIFKLLGLLWQSPPKELYNAPVLELLEWAVQHWNPSALKHRQSIVQG